MKIDILEERHTERLNTLKIGLYDFNIANVTEALIEWERWAYDLEALLSDVQEIFNFSWSEVDPDEMQVFWESSEIKYQHKGYIALWIYCSVLNFLKTKSEDSYHLGKELYLLDIPIQKFPNNFLAMRDFETLNLTNTGIKDLPLYWQDFNATTLYISFNEIKDLGPIVFFPKLTRLFAKGCQVESLPDCLKDIPLKVLNLYRNQIRRFDPVLRDMKNLSVLNLRNNYLLEVPDWIGEMESLEFLYLGENGIRTLPQELSKLKLKHLDLSHNSMKSLPVWLGQMTSLKRLDLKGWRSSQIPLELRDSPIAHLINV